MKTLLLCSILSVFSGIELAIGFKNDNGSEIFIGVGLLLIVVIILIVSAMEGFG